jgi:hypothetical protein
VVLSRCIRRRAAVLELRIADVVALAGCGHGHFVEVLACRACAGIDGLPRLAHALRIELHELFLSADEM